MRALLSVYDKSGIAEFGKALVALGAEVISTGGTLAALQQAGVPVTAVSDVTGFPEILDGRVKTLHPRIHGGLLARRDDPQHRAQLASHEIEPIDLLAVNLYPFAETVRDPNTTLADAIEQIDIGGPAMLRAGAKNFADVIVASNPTDYGPIINELRSGGVSFERRRTLAAQAFAHVAAYDSVVASYLHGDRADQPEMPEQVLFAGQKAQDLRYGENPQQRAGAYRRLVPRKPESGVLDACQISGKELSFNNLLDADAAWGAIRQFDQPAVSIVKHTIPCGLAVRARIVDAFDAALAGDPVSAFGGIVALNRDVDEETANAISAVFFEVIIAPAFTPEAESILKRKKNLRLLALPVDESDRGRHSWDIRPIRGGLLIQAPDVDFDDPSTWTVATQRTPTGAEMDDLIFAWEAVRHVKSNAIVLVKDRAVVGVGSGQPNRVESVRIAVRKAGDRTHGAVLASDAYFPFADGLEAGIDAGIVAAVQPGGSVRDSEVIAAADAAGIAMMFTGKRHFRH
ncbi:MAG TPA: bifunctional phosphoribosylaminoimidazolecarboxamide formyltransferase/IMP cyclohydrolase [Thermomicrobiales bacterium]|nr:bifunctional phosphoribosylaminoimidazolecarboxamide formyltransferase/IMP cyclohydrolase [Thermomicrobiales bacterium]